MTTKTVLLAIVICLALALVIGFGSEKASAQSTGSKLGTKEFEKDLLPNKWEMAAGFGSIFVMIAVMKWV